MGAIASRQNAGVEEADVVSNYAYKYPPRSGNFFGNHFIMGGERFDTPQPEAYLFGENADLNFLGSRPTPFPYPPPQSNEPTKTLRSLVNIRKESLRFVRCPEPVEMMDSSKPGDDEMKASDGKGTYYNIEFTFDCDVRCSITIYYFCTEELTPNGVVYYPRDPSMTSQTYHYKKGANQQFCQLSHVLDPSKYPEEDLLFNMEKEVIPIAIYCQVDEGQEEMRQSHTTIAVVERHTDGTYVLKALKQKLFVDGLCYLLQEIYGIENKNLDTKINSEDDAEESGSECVICMCDVRDTLILPCRHLCLCNSCADSLRYQANNCPICRAPFRALLQIRALQKLRTAAAILPVSPPEGSMEHIPPGYEAVSLVEALNGAPPPPARPAASLPVQPIVVVGSLPDAAAQAAEVLNRGSVERTSTDSLKRGNDDKARAKHKPNTASTPTAEFRMSVLLAREEDSSKRSEEKHASSPLLDHHNHNGTDKHVKVSLDTEPLEGETGTEPEADSDAERKSPLLPPHVTSAMTKCNGSVNGMSRDTSVEMPPHAHIEDNAVSDTATVYTNSGVQSRSAASSPPIAEDSDYFTPEDTSTTILTVPKVATMLCDPPTIESHPQRWALPHHVASLPGTPLSASSVRSSGESYSSSSSTRQLLAPRAAAAAASTVATDTLC